MVYKPHQTRGSAPYGVEKLPSVVEVELRLVGNYDDYQAECKYGVNNSDLQSPNAIFFVQLQPVRLIGWVCADRMVAWPSVDGCNIQTSPHGGFNGGA